MRFKTALSTLPRLAQVEDGELARFAKTRLGDEVPISVEDLRVARDLVKELGRAMARNDESLWKRMKEARDAMMGTAPAAAPVSAPIIPSGPPSSSNPGTTGPRPALPSHLLAAAAAPSSIAATAAGPSPWGSAAASPPPASPAPAPPPAAPAAAHPNVVVPPAALEATAGMQFSMPIPKPLPFQPAKPGSEDGSSLAVTPPPPRPAEEEDRMGMTVPAELSSGPGGALPFPGAPRPSAAGPPSSRNAPAAPVEEIAPTHVAPGQRFTLAQYASLRVDLDEAPPDRRSAVIQAYGLAGAEELARVEGIWRALLKDPGNLARLTDLKAEYSRYLASRRGR